MIVINLQAYGDFDIPISRALMLAPAGVGKKHLAVLKAEAEELFGDTNDVDGIIRYLQDWGFTTVKSFNITVGNNL